MLIRGYDAISAAKELEMPLGKYSEKSYPGFKLGLSIEVTHAFRPAGFNFFRQPDPGSLVHTGNEEPGSFTEPGRSFRRGPGLLRTA
jgi:hypothetical protein